MQTRRCDPQREAAFLFEIFAELRAPELSASGLDAKALRDLLAMQHVCQLGWYRQLYPQARHELLLHDELAVGYWLIDDAGAALTLVDFALLASVRGQGFGQRALRALQRRAAKRSGAIRLRVRRDSPARRLYERCGFEVAEADELDLAMEWRAAQPHTTASDGR